MIDFCNRYIKVREAEGVLEVSDAAGKMLCTLKRPLIVADRKELTAFRFLTEEKKSDKYFILSWQLDDVLIQPVVSEACPSGKLGLGRRGIYDVQEKWPVWEVIRWISPEYVFIITNQDISTDQESLRHYQMLTDSITERLSKYLYISPERCKCFTKLGRNRNEFTKPKHYVIIIKNL